jgi:hypothetical protein
VFTVAKQQEKSGVRLVAVLVPAGIDFEIPDDAAVIADEELTLVNPDRTGGDKAYRLTRVDLRDAAKVNLVLGNALMKGAPIGGVIDVWVSDKVLARMPRR